MNKRYEDFHNKKHLIIEDRLKTLELKEKRKLERLALQIECNQKIFDTRKTDKKFEHLKTIDVEKFKTKVMVRSGAKELLRKKPKNKWNDMTEICDKHLDIILRPG